MAKLFYVLSLCVAFCVAKPQDFMFNGNFNLNPGFSAPEMFLENMLETPQTAMGFNIDPSKVKTKTKIQKKGNMTIKETNKTGPNFYMQEVQVQGENNKGAALKGFPSFSPFLFGGEPMAWNLKKKSNCKNCNSSQFCMDGECVDKRKEGMTCIANNECKKDLLCVFGVCNKADEGDAGTQCKKHDECSDDLCCFSATNAKDIRECTSRLPKGAICDESPFTSFKHFLPFSFRTRRSSKSSCSNPCQDGLKCASNGDGMEKKCVPKGFKFNSAEEAGIDDNNKNAGTDSNDDDGSTEDDDDDDVEEDGKIKVTTEDGVSVPGSNNKALNNVEKDQNKKDKKKHKDTKQQRKHKKKKDQHIKF